MSIDMKMGLDEIPILTRGEIKSEIFVKTGDSFV